MSGSKQVGSVHVLASMNSAKVVTGAAAARLATRQMAQQMKTDTREANGAIALLGEEFGIHLPRHVRTFVASLPGADMLSKLLPAAAVVGLGLAFVEAGKKAYEMYQKAMEVAGAIGEGFEKMHLSAELANDSMAVTNDKLEEQIAKLTGKHVNNLKFELDEAIVEADKLYKSILADNKEVDELLKKNKVDWFTGRLTGQAGTEGITKQVIESDQANADAARTQREDLARYREQIEALGGVKKNQAEESKRQHEGEAIQAAARKTWDSDELIKKALLINAAAEMTAAYNKAGDAIKNSGHVVGMPDSGVVSQTAVQTIAGMSGHRYEDELGTASEDEFNLQLQGQLRSAKGAHEAADAKKKAAAALLEAQKKAAETQMKAFNEQLEELRNNHTVSIEEEHSFWLGKLTALQVGSTNYTTIFKTLTTEYGQIEKANAAAVAKAHSEEESLFRQFNERENKAMAAQAKWPARCFVPVGLLV